MEIFKRKGLNRMKRPPKFQCTVCGRMFKGKRGRDNHFIYNKCRGRKQAPHKGHIFPEEQELQLGATMEPMKYYGREYTYSGLQTGNRHLRTGIPLPRISQYARAAI